MKELGKLSMLKQMVRHYKGNIYNVEYIQGHYGKGYYATCPGSIVWLSSSLDGAIELFEFLNRNESEAIGNANINIR